MTGFHVESISASEMFALPCAAHSLSGSYAAFAVAAVDAMAQKK